MLKYIFIDIMAVHLLIFIFLSCLSISNSASVRPNSLIRRSLAPFLSSLAISGFLPTPQHILPLSLTPVHAAIAPLADVGIKEFLVKDGRQFLRLTLPVGSEMKLGTASVGDSGKMAQEALEIIRLRFEQVGFTNPAAWAGALKDLNTADAILTSKRSDFINKASSQEAAIDLLDNQLRPTLDILTAALRKQDIVTTTSAQEKAGAALAELRALQLPKRSLPFAIPEEYASLPRLLGRATVEVVVTDPKGFRYEDNSKVPDNKITFLVEVDGFHAPLTSGNFVDLVDKKFYDGLAFNKIEELSVQTGQKSAKAEGYVDPKTGAVRTIPLELFYKQDAAPTYGYTSDEDNRATDTMALPFQAYGAVGMARDNGDADSGSSQVFFLKWRQALIAPGRNTLDGFYSNIGYIVKNEPFLSQLTPQSKIVSARVVNGIENLERP